MSLQKLLSKLTDSFDEALDEVIESKIQQHFDKGLLEMRLEKDALSDAKISAVKSLISSTSVFAIIIATASLNNNLFSSSKPKFTSLQIHDSVISAINTINNYKNAISKTININSIETYNTIPKIISQIADDFSSKMKPLLTNKLNSSTITTIIDNVKKDLNTSVNSNPSTFNTRHVISVIFQNALNSIYPIVTFKKISGTRYYSIETLIEDFSNQNPNLTNINNINAISKNIMTDTVKSTEKLRIHILSVGDIARFAQSAAAAAVTNSRTDTAKSLTNGNSAAIKTAAAAVEASKSYKATEDAKVNDVRTSSRAFSTAADAVKTATADAVKTARAARDASYAVRPTTAQTTTAQTTTAVNKTYNV